MSEAQAKILVIGAGMAGLSAAQALQQQGFAVTVLEGRERLGGRIWTNYELGTAIDLGASWIHRIEGNPVTELATQFQVETRSSDYDDMTFYDYDGQRISDDTVEAFDKVFTELFEQKLPAYLATLEADISLASGLKTLLANQSLAPLEQRLLNNFLALTIELDYAAAINTLSLKHGLSDEKFAGEDRLFPGGYHALIAGLAAGLDIRLQQRVISINYHQSPVVVTTEQDEFQADYVIVTVPLGVLKAGVIDFVPLLPPAKQTALKRLGISLLNKIVLQFAVDTEMGPGGRAWPVEREWIGYASQTHPEFPAFLNLAVHGTPPILVGFLGAAYALEQEARSDEELVAHAMKILRLIYGPDFPDPVNYLITRWASDPFSYGSYSHLPVGATPADYETLSQPVAERLFFAGEATTARYFSTVHGAYLTGQREAARIVKLAEISAKS